MIGLAAALASRLPLGFFVKRVWLGIPLFAGIVVLPAIFLVPGVRLFELTVGSLTISPSIPGIEDVAAVAAGVDAFGFHREVGLGEERRVLADGRPVDILADRALRVHRICGGKMPGCFEASLGVTVHGPGRCPR